MNHSGDDVFAVRRSVRSPFQHIAYRLSVLSRLLAVPVLLVYAPAMLLAAALVCGTSRGPAFVKKAYQRGNGTEAIVYLYEFRTECWQTWERTPVGRLLHLTDLHRLPRLFNVLQGQVNVGERLEKAHA